MFDPPPGYVDLLGDAAHAPSLGEPTVLDVPGVGTVLASRARPASIAELAMAANPDLEMRHRQEHLARFVGDHLAAGEYERLTVEMIDGDLPDDTFFRVGRAIATHGTARPYVAVISLAVQTAHHWREMRRRIQAAGIVDPMMLPSMHAVLDATEHALIESMAGEGAQAKRTRFYDSLYAPAPDGTELNGPEYAPAPPGFSPEEVEATFDAFAALMR